MYQFSTRERAHLTKNRKRLTIAGDHYHQALCTNGSSVFSNVCFDGEQNVPMLPIFITSDRYHKCKNQENWRVRFWTLSSTYWRLYPQRTDQTVCAFHSAHPHGLQTRIFNYRIRPMRNFALILTKCDEKLRVVRVFCLVICHSH